MLLRQDFRMLDKDIYKRREHLKKKYSFSDVNHEKQYQDAFLRWFIANNLLPNKGLIDIAAWEKSKRIIRDVQKRRLKHDRALDRFCDLIDLNRMAWKKYYYEMMPEKPGKAQFEFDVSFSFQNNPGSSRPYGTRWSKRLAGVPAEFDLNDACFGASKCVKMIC